MITMMMTKVMKKSSKINQRTTQVNKVKGMTMIVGKGEEKHREKVRWVLVVGGGCRTIIVVFWSLGF